MSDPQDTPVVPVTPPTAKAPSGWLFLLWFVVDVGAFILMTQFVFTAKHILVYGFGVGVALWYALRLGRRTTWQMSLVMALVGSFMCMIIAMTILTKGAFIFQLGADG